MVTAKESQTNQQFSACNSSYLDHMALVQLDQNHTLPCNVAFEGQSSSNVRRLNTSRQDAFNGFLKPLPPYYNMSYPTLSPVLKDAQCASPNGLGVTDKPIDAPQRKFLIFDQSGNHTRLFFSPSFPPQNQTFATKKPTSANGPSEEVATRLDQQFLMRPTVEEKWDENHLTDEEDEMLEDTEEINALLYSDSDDEYGDNDDAENDEVTSTGHSPFSIEEGNEKEKILEEHTEEVASPHGSPKRQRLLDGKYKKSSLVSGESPLKQAISCNYEDDDVESSCAGDGNSYNYLHSCKREKKVKIRQTLKILESIIPGLNSNNNPLSIIDKAIVYLKSMKMEAEALGLSHPGCTFAAPP